MTDTNHVPTYTKVGFRLTITVMLLLTIMILKNCAGSVYYGVTTDQAAVIRYYDIGFAEGVKQAQTGGLAAGRGEGSDSTDNPVLKKSRQKGFRDGWDSVRQNAERQ